MSAVFYCWDVIVGVLVPTNQLIPLAELSRDVRAVVKTTGFSSEDATDSPTPPPFAELRGASGFKSVIEVDQAPIGKTPRSCPATYVGFWDAIRSLFAGTVEARMRGWSASRFSFNVKGGRCETCSGGGRIKLEMAFMPDTYLPCDECHGTRYSADLADITWKGKNIGQVLKMSITEAADFFASQPRIARPLQLLAETGVDQFRVIVQTLLDHAVVLAERLSHGLHDAKIFQQQG